MQTLWDASSAAWGQKTGFSYMGFRVSVLQECPTDMRFFAFDRSNPSLVPFLRSQLCGMLPASPGGKKPVFQTLRAMVHEQNAWWRYPARFRFHGGRAWWIALLLRFLPNREKAHIRPLLSPQRCVVGNRIFRTGSPAEPIKQTKWSTKNVCCVNTFLIIWDRGISTCSDRAENGYSGVFAYE